MPHHLWTVQSVWSFALFCAVLVTYRTFSYFLLRNHVSIWRFSSVVDLYKLMQSAALASVMFFITDLIILPYHVPPLVLFIELLLFLFFSGGARVLIRRIFEQYVESPSESGDALKVLIYGAGRAGELLLRNIKSSKNSGISVVGLIDDDPFRRGRRIHNVPVIGSGTDIKRLTREYSINEIYFAISSLSGSQTRRLLKLIDDQVMDAVKVKIMPGLKDLVGGNVTVNQLRNVEIKDLLRRRPVELDKSPVLRMVNDRRVLVVGGGGSIGSELCRQVASINPKQLIIIDSCEFFLYQITEQLALTHPRVEVHPVVMDVCREEQLRQVFSEYRPEHVFHAAAYKHVPLMESNIRSAIYNNVMATISLTRMSIEFNVSRFVLISTDKAVQPTNVMGATKRMCELIVLNASTASQTKFMAVRFGNVLGSSGSVIPKFKEQIKKGGPVTVTDPEITRYFMLIPEAVELVLQAGAIGETSSIFVLNMGEPIRIRDLAEYMIKLSGLTPNEDIKIEYTGLRPGEKMHESLYLEGEECNTNIPDLMIMRSSRSMDNTFSERAEQFAGSCLSMGENAIRSQLREFVPEYHWGASSLKLADQISAVKSDAGSNGGGQ
ncbi:UDP-N-acetyl-alpha-D-glucosamine C6 dehydratase [bacterium BMS3Bbin04]|nr:UDP-N-acetyl-alpha-D-glucosamine C6 dehydratase [bacterium BMS3Bbin04]